ncbi:MAG: flagellar basal body-associated FliL family protein [Planctomycetia bacterium]|nr:flagellar basal body-associated FliL family protein [Planctomycetia bacterium]
MPKQPTPPPDQAPEVTTESSPGGRSLLARIKIVLLVLAVVLVECGIAYLWLPNVSEAEAKASAEATLAATEESAEETESKPIEVDLGEFTVMAYQPASNSTLRIDFHLYGTITQEANEEFVTLKEGNHARLREQVTVIVRSAEIADLTDPGLGLIKRRILEKINRTLGKPLVQGVVVSDFSFIEQ